MTRRGLAAAVVMVAALAVSCGHAGPPTFTVRRGPALRPAPEPPLPAGAPVRTLHLADFGEDNLQQATVAGAVAEAHRRAPFGAAVFAGDNLYPCGPDPARDGAAGCAFSSDDNAVVPGTASPADPAFALHERPLAPLAEAPGVEVWLALGNHDVAACGTSVAGAPRLRACLEVARRSPLWRMPGRHYAVDRGAARFIFVDTNLAVQDYGGFSFEDEVAFVAEQAAGCADRLCFLVGHHPPLTAGSHAGDDVGSARFVERIDRLLAAGQGRVRAFLAGHDHDLQHLRTAEGLDVLVSGNGARGRPHERFQALSRATGELLFGSVRWGFAVLDVYETGWRYRFVSTDGAPIYCCAADATGPCRPTTCG